MVDVKFILNYKNKDARLILTEQEKLQIETRKSLRCKKKHNALCEYSSYTHIVTDRRKKLLVRVEIRKKSLERAPHIHTREKETGGGYEKRARNSPRALSTRRRRRRRRLHRRRRGSVCSKDARGALLTRYMRAESSREKERGVEPTGGGRPERHDDGYEYTTVSPLSLFPSDFSSAAFLNRRASTRCAPLGAAGSGRVL